MIVKHSLTNIKGDSQTRRPYLGRLSPPQTEHGEPKNDPTSSVRQNERGGKERKKER